MGRQGDIDIPYRTSVLRTHGAVPYLTRAQRSVISVLYPLDVSTDLYILGGVSSHFGLRSSEFILILFFPKL